MPRPKEILGRAVDVATGPFSGETLLRESAPDGRRALALTFDDGPSRETTPAIADLLEENGALGTFFVVGDRIPGAEPVLHRLAAGGHELANHTYTHPHTTYLSRHDLREEIVSTTAAVEQIGASVRFVRPPFGKDRRRFVSLSHELGLRVALWSIDSGDSTGYPPEKIVATVEENAKPGAIVLFHDHGKRTAETLQALRAVVPTLRNAGFELVTLTELVGA
jgi:peptidoglycan-N-acetylglucosamine deacetylase